MIFALCLLAAPAGAQPAPIDVEKATVLYNEGLERRDAGDHAAALDLFRTAYARVPSPVIGLDLAREHLHFGQLVQALAIAQAVVRLPVAPEETEKSATARAEAARLAGELPKRIPKLRVLAPPGATVLVDGRLVPSAELGGLAVDPGKHEVIVASASATKHEVTVAEGEVRDVSVAPPAPPPSAPPPIASPRPSYTLTYVGLATAGAGLVAGTVTGLLALSYAQNVHEGCAGGRCPSDLGDDLRASRTLGTISTISFATAAGGVVLAAYGWLRATDRPSTPRVGAAVVPTPFGVSASFVGAF
ncbi:MAG: tetratricopeptide repeat protein [Deltaproteobacteria bacterium]|nr:tetratricopeptide repeat protein [Deltaproteobacteria bacterium]